MHDSKISMFQKYSQMNEYRPPFSYGTDQKVERKIQNWTRNPFSVWVVIYLNDFPHPILYEVKHPRFGVTEEKDSDE